MNERYGADYYEDGIAKGLSNYVDFRWMPERTRLFAERLRDVMDMGASDTFLDWGAAKGFVVRAMRELGVEAWGYDISQWAVQNCDPAVTGLITNTILHDQYDHVLMKDVAEHLEISELIHTFSDLLQRAQKTILVIVPLTETVGGPYVRKEDDLDATHVIRWPLEEWLSFFQRRVGDSEWTVSASWHIPGLKPTSFSHLKSCGFFLFRRHF